MIEDHEHNHKPALVKKNSPLEIEKIDTKEDIISIIEDGDFADQMDQLMKEELKKSSAKNQVLHKGAFVCRMKEFMNSNFLHSFKEAVT